MAISTAMNNQFKRDLMLGLHDLDTHTVKIALYVGTATLNGTTPNAYTTTDEITNTAGSAYTAGGATLAGGTVTLDSTTGICDFTDASWTTASFTTGGALLWNDTHASNAVISTHTFGGDQTVSAGTFTVVFPAAAAATAIIRIA